MTTYVESARPLVSSIGLTGIIQDPAHRPGSEARLFLDFAPFDYCLTAPIVSFNQRLNAGIVSMQLALDEGARLNLTLSGKLSEDRGQFSVEEAGLQIALIEERPQADFVAATLSALLGLSENVRLRIPEIGLDLNLRFDLSLLYLSQQLSARQTDYRLMVVERATGLELVLPASGFSGQEVGDIMFVYNAITLRSFTHALDDVQLFIPGDSDASEMISFLSEIDRSGLMPPLEPKLVSRTILGQSVPLGPQSYSIDDAFVEDLDYVLKELALGDAREVRVTIRSRKNSAVYDLPQAPKLPESPWAPEIQELVDLESRLDSELVRRYHALASASLANLTEEESAEVTERPELDEDAFLISGIDIHGNEDNGEGGGNP